MADLFYFALAYAVFWLFSFGFIFNLFNRQRKLNEELTMLQQLLDKQSEE